MRPDGSSRSTPSLGPLASSWWPFLLFLVPYLVWVIHDHARYGYSWNEVDVYSRGLDWLRNWKHVPGSRNMWIKLSDTDGWVLYDHAYAGLLNLLNPHGEITRFHAWNMLAFAPLFAAAYGWMLHRTGSPWRALACPGALFLLPRLTGDIAPNPKDSIFAAAFFVALTLIASWAGTWDRRAALKTIALGLAIGGTASLRILGLCLLPLWWLYEAALATRRMSPNSPGAQPGGSLPLRWVVPGVTFVAHALLFSTWPYLLADPLPHYLEMLGAASRFQWTDTVLYMGQNVPASALPWHYLPVWFWITTPISLMALFLLALWKVLRHMLPDRDFLLATVVGLALFLVFVLRPTIYDGLRHFLFILPILGVLAVGAFWDLWDRLRGHFGRFVLVVLVVGDLLGVAIHMIRLHPYEYVYFNAWAGGLAGAAGRYETDYLAESLPEGVLQLRERRAERPGVVATCTEKEQTRPYLTRPWSYGPLDKADYYLSTTRWDWHLKAEGKPLLFQVEREGVPLLYAYQMK